MHPRSLGKRENDCTGRRAAIPNVVRSRNIVPLSIASRWRCSQYLERVIHRVRLKGRWPCLLLLHIGADDAGDRSAVGNQAPQGTKLAQRFDFVGGAASGTPAALCAGGTGISPEAIAGPRPAPRLVYPRHRLAVPVQL